MNNTAQGAKAPSIRVLVIDDNVDFAENMTEILADEGSEVFSAGTIAEGRAAIAERQPDICFVDLRLPDGSGEELIGELAKSGSECLAIVLTGNASLHSAVAAVNAGAFGFLLKDMPVEGILASYRRAVERIQLVAQKRDLELMLRHREQLAMIGKMSATLAHEIKNPLTGISEALGVLVDAIGEPAPELREMKDSIVARFRSLNAMVDDLLEYSKPLNLRRRRIGLTDFLDTVIADLEVEGRFVGVTIERDFHPDAGTIDVDPNHFRMVLGNLLRNADEAMNDSSTKRLRLRARPVDGLTMLEIEDSGPGVSPDLVERVFEPFFTTKTRGTGLGLALAMRIVDEHGGSIGVRNVEGAGACFKIVLPG